jgi:hypothetical protein
VICLQPTQLCGRSSLKTERAAQTLVTPSRRDPGVKSSSQSSPGPFGLRLAAVPPCRARLSLFMSRDETDGQIFSTTERGHRHERISHPHHQRH